MQEIPRGICSVGDKNKYKKTGEDTRFGIEIDGSRLSKTDENL